MNEREKIFARIREALKVPAPFPGTKHGSHGGSAPSSPQSPREWLPPGGSNYEERLALFRRHAEDLKADFRIVNSVQELQAELAKLCAAGAWRKVASHAGELTSPGVANLGLPVLFTDAGYEVKELEQCDVGLTECDALIAQTGSVLVTARSAGGRALSVLPPHHVVLARRSQLLPDLTEGFALLKQKYGENYPSFISFITGPSRTGDIERILVLGAHGPKQLTILFLEAE